jgi:ketosteroid isomerase-like protein
MSAELVTTFYTALADRDGEAMAHCYSEDIVFEDPAFGVLTGRDAGDMWRMLCSSATDLAVTHTIETIAETTATVNWVANYTFTATGRSVRNDVTATMKFRDGRIIDHRDDFDFWKWSSQALGVPGKFLGWSPFLKAKVQKTTRRSLDAFQARQV